MDSHVGYLLTEFSPEDGIAVAQQITRDPIKWECLPQLLSRPLGSWVGGDVEVHNATPVMGQHQKHVKDLETEVGHGEEVDGDQLLKVIVEEGAPSLRRRLSAAPHVFADAGLTDLDAEFEQLTVDAGCTPPGILPAHPSDQSSDLAGSERSTGLTVSHLPGPE